MYLMWYDDNPKTPAAVRLTAACEAYAARWHTPATVAIVNECDRDAAAPAGVELRVSQYVSKNNYQIGRSES